MTRADWEKSYVSAESALREAGVENANLLKLEEIRVHIALQEFTLPRGGREKLTVSIGAASWHDDGKTVDELLDVADARLYAAKNAGRNRVVGP